ncbi:MAG: hypothetical protein IJT65_00745 [Eubacterium sp.]|nr:hypothetical protein [Eubacterium sp.]
MLSKKYIAVIDTETNWHDEVMSIGVVIADENYNALDGKYYVIVPEVNVGGMFIHEVSHNIDEAIICSRADALFDIEMLLSEYGIDSLFAYNALFDKGHLRELCAYKWYDIMRLAAYVQYNRSIPEDADICSTGRLKRGFGVQPIYRMLCGDTAYCEVHNALDDAYDELTIMRMLGHTLEAYEIAKK